MGALDALLRPRAVAVVGASPSPAKAGHQLLLSLAPFPGPVHPVHPRASEVAGRPAHPSVGAIGEPVDLALLAVPPAALLAALRDCAEAGVGAAAIHAGGLAEAGAEGAALQAELLDVARSAEIRLLGPNTSGFLDPAARLHATFVPGVAAIAPGPLAIVAQSGGVNHQLAFAAQAEGIGVRLAIGLGNAADVDVPDVLDQLADDAETGAVVLALEGVRDGRRLIAAIERLTARVPVIALKAGRADVGAFAQSHTGALTGSYRVAHAGLAQAGAVVVQSTQELLDAARALLCGRLAPREHAGLGIVTGQAGPGLLLADELSVAGVRVPELGAAPRARLAELLDPITYQRNPVDTGRPGPSFREVVATVGGAEEIDALVVHALLEPGALDPVADLSGATDVPVVFSTGGPPAQVADVTRRLAGAGIATFASPERAARAAAALVQDAARAWRRRERDAADAAAAAPLAAATGAPAVPLAAAAPLVPARPLAAAPPAAPAAPLAAATGAPAALTAPLGAPAAPLDAPAADPLDATAAAGPWDEASAKALVAALGLAVPAGVVCADRAEAHAALARLRAPVALKLVHPQLRHKSERGALRLGIATPRELDAAVDALAAIDDLQDARLLVEEMAPSGPELLLGAVRDPAFGPIVVLGAGGVAAEALDDVAVRIAPVAVGEAAAMLGELASAQLFGGFRGQPAVDVHALGAAIAALSRWIAERPDVAEVEVNPLRVTAHGLIALDALVVAT
ncbi:acetate--CoA ligase family protein [Conexibacter woesei]|uniref:CoA-binding domain protein n=1 Tax=Conexibacter woesei (strain DSM 14684 / CCUG 47730 / CIP 108061 / JCM 11494 / NBRC 100937 / ID131577) TaxID=469383 RepID=D3FAS4_CONWI|nr:acetate--CoA ligase family protein [Conexibacter woesei]ADB51237.1 CoA-binding domain protein [Conexibacter woesei DSM 14684]